MKVVLLCGSVGGWAVGESARCQKETQYDGQSADSLCLHLHHTLTNLTDLAKMVAKTAAIEK